MRRVLGPCCCYFYSLLVLLFLQARVTVSLSLSLSAVKEVNTNVKTPSLPSCIGRVSIPSKTKNNSNSNNNNKRSRRINYHICGTSHVRCNSYKEVSALINLVRPDATVIELDPERALRLTLDDAMLVAAADTSTRQVCVDDNDNVNDKSLKKSSLEQIKYNRLFGADFLAAIEESKK